MSAGQIFRPATALPPGFRALPATCPTLAPTYHGRAMSTLRVSLPCLRPLGARYVDIRHDLIRCDDAMVECMAHRNPRANAATSRASPGGLGILRRRPSYPQHTVPMVDAQIRGDTPGSATARRPRAGSLHRWHLAIIRSLLI